MSKDAGGEHLPLRISAGSVVKAILVVLLFVALYKLIDIVLVLLTAVVIASALEPATRQFMRLGIPRIPSVILLYISIALAFFGIFYFLLPPLAEDILNLTTTLPQYIESINIEERLFQVIPLKLLLPGDQITQFVTDFGSGFLQAASSLFGGLFSFVLMIVLSFYLAVQERGIENVLRLVSPLSYESYVIDLWTRSQRKIGYWLQGQLLLGFLMGVFVYLGMTLLGLKYALLLGLLAMVFEIIPIFGPILAAVPAIAIGLTESLTKGLVVLGFFVIFQQFENHLIYPLVVRKLVGVPPLLAILSLIVGGKLAGFLGVVIAVPMAAVLMELLGDIERHKQGKVT